MSASLHPTIAQCTSFLAKIERTGQKRELYKYMSDSSEPNSTRIDTRWVNEKDYNFVNVQFSATFNDLSGFKNPDYVEDFKFGVVSGKIQLDLTKIDRNDPSKPYISINKTVLDCPENPGSLAPNDSIYWCNFTDPNFDRVLEHGDNLTLTIIATSGGYRKLRKLHGHQMDIFRGQNASKATRFRFDFKTPYHCLIDGKCNRTSFNVDEDITKKPIRFHWNGWTDEMSGIEKYTIQEYFLVPDNEVIPKLHEPDPWNPQRTFEFNSTSNSYTFVPENPGMYSFILNVIDAANNTEYARTLVLYDPKSKITVSNISSDKIKAVSAIEETGFMWQDNLNKNIKLSWKGHFRNSFHDKNKLLNRVSPYKYYEFQTDIKKNVKPQMEDLDGKRTLEQIQNIHGITKFEYAYKHANLGMATPKLWIPVNDSFSEFQEFFTHRRDGDAINFWIKATDIMGNTKIDIAHIYFDSSPPSALTQHDVIFYPNLNISTYSFSSRLQIDASDIESGIFKISWRLIANESGIVFKTGNLTGNKTDKYPGIKEGYRIASDDYYYISHFLNVDNCWMVVPKENTLEESILLELIVFNMAMKSTLYNTTLSDLSSLDGMDQYSGPMHLKIAATYDNGVRLKWDLAPSCYGRSRIIVRYFSSDGRSVTKVVDKDADWFDLTGLDSEKYYNLTFITEYGQQQSDPVFMHFKTLRTPSVLTAGRIAGIGIVMLILLSGVIGMVVLWRMGRLSLVKEGIQRRVTVVRKRINNRLSAAYTNRSYEDDIYYVYGQMEFNEEDSWILPSSSIVLESLVTSGRFADIYKASYKSKQNSDERGIVVAKILKCGFTEDDVLMMKAKINFLGKEVGEHQNILLFLGAVVDNNALGPYMILEYCEKGQLCDWLLDQKNVTTDDVVEHLYRIVYGISRGMCHLETKKILHRKLGARNVLLTDELEPKICGFGPHPPQKAEDDGDGDTKSNDKERIPIRWAAPECLISMKDASSKSDVWSFGIVLWEIFSLGDSPYPGLRSREVKERVNDGYRMKRPEFANDFYYKLMMQCWQGKPKQRPTFKELMKKIGETFSSAPADECYYYSEK